MFFPLIFVLGVLSLLAWAAVATIAMGALVEIAQGVTNKGHYRLRDLIPDAVGILVGFIVVLLLNRIRRRPQPS